MAEEEGSTPGLSVAVSDALSGLGVTAVETDVLLAFATAVEAEMASYVTALETVSSPFSDPQAMVNFGGGGLAEGEAFLGPYLACMSAMLQFSGDVAYGLLSLSTGASVVAVEYVAGDTDSASLIAAVDAAFAPPADPEVLADRAADERDLDQQRRANEAEFEDRVDEAIEEIRESEQDDRADSEHRIPYSDYYDTGRAAAIGPDRQDVNQYELPGYEESILDEVDLYELPSEQPEELRDEIDRVQESLRTDDPPGTSDDVHNG